MPLPFASYGYQDCNASDTCNWQGVVFAECEEFETFLSSDVRKRHIDEEESTAFQACLRDLSLTKFGSESLRRVLEAPVKEDRGWEIGEALAEAFLAKELAVVWPWNNNRDKKNYTSNLQGADLVGFMLDGTSYRLVLGEVKTSQQKDCPPSVVQGRPGSLGHQIDELANNLSVVYQLLKWLYSRCKGTPAFFEAYQQSLTKYLESGNLAVTLFGVLIRDTPSNPLDLRARGASLRTSIKAPTRCNLIAIYLPHSVDDLAKRINAGAA